MEPVSAPAVQKQAETTPRRDLDCTFFHSQAFNRPNDHFLAQMARMCGMLSRYKTAVIEANTRRYHAAQEDERASAGNRVAPMAAATDSSKYLIAREIGLIDAMGALDANGEPADQ
ncbi:MAG: hypothetical protein AAF565_01930 [Pseudomonadota bacterium]